MVRRTSAIHGRLIANNNSGCLQKMLTPIIKLKQNDGEDPAKIQHHTLILVLLPNINIPSFSLTILKATMLPFIILYGKK